MSIIDDPVFEFQFLGTLFFFPQSEDSVICQLELSTWGACAVARMTVTDSKYEIKNEMLLCPDGELRYRSKKTVDAYRSGIYVQLQLVKDRLTRVTFEGEPYLRVVGDWIERSEDKNGKVRMASYGMEGLLKQTTWPSTRLGKKDIHGLHELHEHWGQVSDEKRQFARLPSVEFDMPTESAP